MNKIIEFLGEVAGHSISGFVIGVIATMAQTLSLSPDMQTSFLLMFLGGAIGFLKGIIFALEEKMPKITAVKMNKSFKSYFGF